VGAPCGGKLDELDEQIAQARGAREALEHVLRCPHEDIVECPSFDHPHESLAMTMSRA
jgi:hypothetical protein